MSVQTQIDRIKGNVTRALAKVSEKGVTVPNDANSDDLETLIGAIQGGGGSGGGTHENCIPYGEAFTATVSAVDGVQYGFALNSAGYYENQNKGVDSSYALCRVNLSVLVECNVVFDVINNAEYNYDYGLFGALDKPLNKNNYADSGVKKSYKTEHSTKVVTLVYENVPAGDHFIDVKFIKDSSGKSGTDNLQFRIGSSSAVLLSEEYYPILSRTQPVLDAFQVIAEKGVDSSGAGFADIAGLIGMIPTTNTVLCGTFVLASGGATDRFILKEKAALGFTPNLYVLAALDKPASGKGTKLFVVVKDGNGKESFIIRYAWPDSKLSVYEDDVSTENGWSIGNDYNDSYIRLYPKDYGYSMGGIAGVTYAYFLGRV